MTELSPWLAVGDPLEEEVVGRGTAGTVSRAAAGDGRQVALKRFGTGMTEVGVREASLLRRVDRRFGPRLIDACQENESVVIVLEWLDGRPLDPILTELSSAPVEERILLAARVAHGVGRGLAELHEMGVRHGDVKPANVLVHDRLPKRDAADDRGATLIDLSLAADMTAALEGATLAYLAPEARRDPNRVGPETDLWAFGCLLHAIVGEGAAAEESEPARWAEALRAPSAGARPQASFVAARAARFLNLTSDPEEAALARRARVRRTYLRARERVLTSAVTIDPAIQGMPRRWLEGALSSASERDVPGASIAPLDAIARGRWLTALFGSPPPEGVAQTLDESALADVLLELAERRQVFAYADLTHRSSLAADRTASLDHVSGAVALSQSRPSHELLAWAEAELAEAPPSFAITLAEALVRVGEIGRAWLVLSRLKGAAPNVLALGAEVARRRGDVVAAEGMATRASEDSNHEVASRARAVLARLAWDRGDYERAMKLLEGADGAGAAETRGLVAYALANFEEGLGGLSLAMAESPSSEARARLEGVRGMLEHGRGDPAASLAAFTRAVDLAASVSIVEEATYLTGLAAAATDLGDLSRALPAATRAALLWERLGQSDRAARAWLARASALALVGADHEARAAADEALDRAGRCNDVLAVAFAHLVHAETRSRDDVEAVGHLRTALAVLPERATEERLRVEARLLAWCSRGEDALSAGRIAENDRAAESASPSTRWEWWGARAATCTAGRHPTGVHGDADRRTVLTALTALFGITAPAASRAGALLAAAELARQAGDGEIARRFERARRDLGATLRLQTPPEYRARLEAAAWMSGLGLPEDGAGSALEPAQIAQLETLVRSLGARDRLAPLLNQVLDALLLWTGVERGLLLLRAPDGTLVARAGRNLARSDLEGEQRTLSLGIARRALDLGDVVVATDAFAALGELHASVHALRLRSVLAVPLIARGEALGVVYLDDRARRGAFGPREIAWVRLLSTHAALAVADARDGVRLRRAIRHAERAKLRLERDLHARERELDSAKAALEDESAAVRYKGQIGRSEAMRRTLHLVARVASSDVPILIVGESGTGKELLARAIHDSGERSRKPFVTENCGAVPETLLESILFGHKKGAFTGASANRAGLFEIADGGTLFLDEIGEMSASMQAKLLRVLQDGEIRAVGGERTRRVDVRILTATHRDLEAMVKAGTFREDLFYRLNVVRLDVPSLRERSEDIAALVAYLVEKYAQGRPVKVTRAAMDRLTAYPWPGNVRQLENEVRRALVLGGDRIDAADLSPEILRSAQARRIGGTDLRSKLDALEAELVQEALDKTRGNQTKAAELLGVSRFGLQKMIKRLGLVVPT